jgi:hypothetical protein
MICPYCKKTIMTPVYAEYPYYVCGNCRATEMMAHSCLKKDAKKRDKFVKKIEGLK